ncbi:LOW QUALITY PROTEIN: NFATC2-interacting protein [Plecturocebus cupreus]
MAESVRKRGRWPRGSGAEGVRAARAVGAGVLGLSARGTLDVVSVDLVSHSDEDVLEVATACGAADAAEVVPPETPGLPRPGMTATVTAKGRARGPQDPRGSRWIQGGAAGSGGLSGLHHEDSPSPGSPWKTKLRTKDKEKEGTALLNQDSSPLPPSSPRTKSGKLTRALKKLREVNKRLQDLHSCLSPKPPQGQDQQDQEDEVVLVEGPILPETPRLFPLKIRCRADVIRFPVRMWEPLQSVVDHMATHLVDPFALWRDRAIPTATPRTLKLGVADIINCVVLASSPEATETSQQLQLGVQGKEKHQTLEVSLSRDSLLKTLMSHYEEAMGLSGQKLSFFFDGTKLSGRELPADLGVESGDLIEVWG